jgi:hydroxypyruvate reductase
MNKPKVLQNGRLLPALEAELARQYDLHPLWQEADQKSFLAARGAEFVALATSARIGATAALIDALPALKVISSFGVGYDTIDIEHAARRGIPVGYTPDVLNDCVADTAFGLVIDVARRFAASDRYTRSGQWLKAPYPLTTRVSGKRLGILGLGRIGQVVARRASGFDMEVRYHNRNPKPDLPYTYEPTLKSLAEWCDFLVVVSAGGAETRHLVSSEVLRALGPKGFLINVARGSVIDEEALVQALDDGTIAGAGLDVYTDEPNVPTRLLAMEQVTLLPHVASATHETRQAMADLVLENLAAYFATGRLKAGVPSPA